MIWRRFIGFVGNGTKKKYITWFLAVMLLIIIFINVFVSVRYLDTITSIDSASVSPPQTTSGVHPSPLRRPARSSTPTTTPVWTSISEPSACLGVRSKTGQVVEWAMEDLLKGLEEFIPIYENRPVTDMRVMGFDHSFGVWFIARWLKPEMMVDWGSFRGYSTWVLCQAMPETPIVFLSPHNPCKYLRMGPIYVDENCIDNGEYGFTEFEFVSWPNMLDKLGVLDRSRVMLLFEKVEDTAVWTTVARLEIEQRGRNFGEKQK